MKLYILLVLIIHVFGEYYPFDIGIRDICMSTSPAKLFAINLNLPISSPKIAIKQISWLLVSNTANEGPVYINGIKSTSVNPCCGSLCDFGLHNTPWHQAPCGIRPVCSPLHRMMYADFTGTDVDINGIDTTDNIELRFSTSLPIGFTLYKRVPALTITYMVIETNYTFTSTMTYTPTPSYTTSPSNEPSISANETLTASWSESQTASESNSQTPSQTSSTTQSQTASQTSSQTQSQTNSQTSNPTSSQTQSQTASQTSSQTQSQTNTQTSNPTSSQTQSQTSTQTQTPSNNLRGIIQQQPLIESYMFTMILLGVSASTATGCLLCCLFYICKKCNSRSIEPVYQTYTTGSIPNNVVIPVDSIAVQPRHIRIVPMMTQDEDPPTLQVRQANIL
jgi:hypothetical protein